MFLIFRQVVILSVFALILGMNTIAFAADDKNKDPKYNYNEVETLIFGLSHMDNVDYGHTLKYKFIRKSVFGKNYTDHIEMIISKGEGVKNKSAAFNFFSGQNRRPYPPFGFISSNPLLTLYFNKDAWDLARKIKAKGVANYLRNRIVDGISNVKTIGKTTCSYNGKELPAKIISFTPYIKDENNHQLAHYSGIKYEITMAEDLPGGLCEIKSVVPQHVGGVPAHITGKFKKAGMLELAKETVMVTKLKDAKEPLVVEVLTFSSISKTVIAKTD